MGEKENREQQRWKPILEEIKEGGGHELGIGFFVMFSLYKVEGQGTFNPGIFPYEF